MDEVRSQAVPPEDSSPDADLAEDVPVAVEAGATPADQEGPPPRRKAIVVAGLGVAAGSAGAVLGWRATATEEYPLLVAAWILLTPLVVVAATVAVRHGLVGHRRIRRATGAAVAVLVVGGLAETTRRVDPCDLRGPGVILVGCNLAGRDLRGDNLLGADLRGANLSRAELGGAVLAGALLTEARLTRADLRKANLAEANLEGAFLDGANLAGATLDRAVGGGATLAGADLTDASLVKARFGGVSLVEAQLVRAAVLEADLSGANLAGASLSEASGARVKLATANLTGASLDGARLDQADIGMANLSGASLKSTQLGNLRAAGADFSRAVLHGADLHNATLDRATFAGAHIEEVNLRSASLKEAVMTDVTLRAVSLSLAKLEGVIDLAEAALASALGVDPAKVPRTLSLQNIQFDPPDRILAAVGPACTGAVAAGPRAFTASADFHPNLVLNGSGKASDIGPLRQLRTSASDQKWAPARLRDAELVTCVDDEVSRQVQDCGLYQNRDTAELRSVVRVQLSRHLRAVSSATGQTVAERTFLGEAPRACQTSESFPPGTGPGTIRGTAPSADEMQAWLTNLVNPSAA